MRMHRICIGTPEMDARREICTLTGQIAYITGVLISMCYGMGNKGKRQDLALGNIRFPQCFASFPKPQNEKTENRSTYKFVNEIFICFPGVFYVFTKTISPS